MTEAIAAEGSSCRRTLFILVATLLSGAAFATLTMPGAQAQTTSDGKTASDGKTQTTPSGDAQAGGAGRRDDQGETRRHHWVNGRDWQDPHPWQHY
jgi:hypothetical protein